MLSPLAAFHERSVPVMLGYMWSSSVYMYVFVPSVNVTGSFPMGCIFVPFTARG